MKRKLKLIIWLTVMVIASIILSAAICLFSLIAIAHETGADRDYKNYLIPLSEGLTETDGIYSLPEEYEKYLDDYDRFAMLIDTNGNVVWEHELPEDMPKTYSLQSIASMTRWYCNDYPVFMRTRDDGLFVIGYPKGSTWKYELIFPIKEIDYIIKGVVPLTLAMVTVILVLGMIFNKRLMKEREEARTEWISGISHDIRTPLTMITGCAEELCKTEGNEAEVILKNAESIASLVADMNLVNRLQYGMQPMNKAVVRAAAVIRSAAVEVLNTTDCSSHEIEVGPLDESIFISGDEKLLTRALVNIIRNSVVHNPNGCTISISLKQELFGAEIVIKDDGCGYPARIVNGVIRSEGAHGLGLVIAEKTIKSHRGKIKFMNKNGAYTDIRLPLSIKSPFYKF